MPISQKSDVEGKNRYQIWNQRNQDSLNEVSHPRQQQWCSPELCSNLQL